MYCYCSENTPVYYVNNGNTLDLIAADGGVIPVPLRWALFFRAIPPHAIPLQVQTACDAKSLNLLVRHVRILSAAPLDKPVEHTVWLPVSGDLGGRSKADIANLISCARGLDVRYLLNAYIRFWRNQGWGNVPL